MAKGLRGALSSLAAVLVLALALAPLLAIPARAVELEGFDDPVEVATPVHNDHEQAHPSAAVGVAGAAGVSEAGLQGDSQPGQAGSTDAADMGSGAGAPASGTDGQAADRPKAARRAAKRQNFYLEISALVFIVTYVTLAFLGQRTNHKLSKAWTRAFASAGSVLDKSFSIVGTEEGDVLTPEAPNVFKFYARGKRHCQGMLATLNLLARQDLVSRVWYLISPTEDTLDVDVFMLETSMPPIVLALGTPKVARNLQQDRPDVKNFTRRINIAGDQAPGWPNKKLHVLAEHSSVFYDLITDPRVLQLFTAPQHAEALKYFRMVHITSENTEGSHKRQVRFQFALPPHNQMEVIAPLMSLIPILVDIVGAYRLPPDIKKKLSDARAKAEAAAQEDARKGRLEAIQQRKLEKLQEEKERIARLPPDVRRKLEEKQAKQMAKKQQRIKMVRM